MNILIPHPWLLEFLDTKAKPADIARMLSLCGPSVERIETINQEPVYDIEVTSNRVDAMSVYGIAREAAVILPQFDVAAKLLPLNKGVNHIELVPGSLPPLDLNIQNDPQLCHRILALKLEAVTIKDSPSWLKQRLEQVGQRPLNNIIDVTNYVMWEIGHPIHAFDYDRLTHKTVIVRLAKKGEIATTLDGKTYQMLGCEVIFDDGTGTIIDLPGIMGTQNTVVTPDTKNVLLWIESIDPVNIRHASMGHAIRSQAAILNEKSVDPHLGKPAILRAAQLLQPLASAKIASQLLDIFPRPPQISTTILDQNLIDTYLGKKLKTSPITRILTGLGCRVKLTDSSYLITPPTWRANDLAIPPDYIEEIARIYGYHNLDSHIMATPIPDHPDEHDFRLEHQVKQWLAGWGAAEVYTYSMVSKQLALLSGYSLTDHLQLQNPYSSDWVYMRRSLLPSLDQVLSDNPNHKTAIFELQNTYHPPSTKAKLPRQTLTLSLVSNTGFPHLKGLLDALMAKLFIDNFQVRPDPLLSLPFAPNKAGHILVGQTRIGTIGQLANDQVSVYGFTLDFYALESLTQRYPRALLQSNQAPIIEDLTFTLPAKTPIGPIIDTIAAQSRLIESVKLTSTYHQNATFTITYRRSDRPLQDQDVAPIRTKIVHVLKKLSLTLVGKLQ